VLRQIRPYGCRKVADLGGGFELWETGWGSPFTLGLEKDGHYSKWQFDRIFQLILETMPRDGSWPQRDP
jgi:hypothetical protein